MFKKDWRLVQKNLGLNYGKSWNLSRKLPFSNVLQVLFLPRIIFTRLLSTNGEALHDAVPATDCSGFCFSYSLFILDFELFLCP